MDLDTQLKKIICAAIIYAAPLWNPPSGSGFRIRYPEYGSAFKKSAVSGSAYINADPKS
jgi:hypothetical protein